MDETEENVVGGTESWWRRHGLTVFILFLAAGISLLLRVIYAYQLIGTCDIQYCFAGGSDSFYHFRVMEWIIDNHNNLVHDPELNYPLGAVNPREPLFDWMNAILGIVLAPLFGGNAVLAGSWVLEMQPPFWAAVGVFPVYLLGKEVSSRRMGLVAALLYPLVVGNLESTVATYANYLPFYTFFVLLAVYTYLHAVRLAGTKRWVESYRSPRSIWEGLKAFVRNEEHSVKWGVLCGVTLGATMLAWQGYTIVVVVIVGWLAVTLLAERVRRHDTFGPYVLTLLAGTIGFVMAMPYYYVQGEFGYWFSVPILLYFGGCLILLPFLLMRDTPWVVSIPILLGSIGAGAGALYLYSPAYFNAVLTGQGYFVKNLIFSTVAEAQAPSFDALIVSYGVGTFLLTFVGLAIFIAYLVVYRFRREHIFMVLFGVLSIYLPISAAKFFLLGSPIFVLLPAEAILLGLDRIGGFPQLRRNLANLSERGSRWMALRRSLKVRNFVLAIVVLLVVLPNVSWAVDSSIPYNLQSQYSQQIYNSLPSALQTNPANATSFYLGIGGIDTDTPQQYDEAGYNWLATQDTYEPPADRPALVSWWDYGFQTIAEGDHPAVADNFQNGIDPSGNFLLAQNESSAIAVLAADLIIAEATKSGDAYLPSSFDAILHNDGVNTTALHSYMVNTSADVQTVLSNPSFSTGYGTHDAANLDPTNSEYDTVSHLLASTLSENGVVKVYQDVQTYTGWSIRYAMADTRLFPTSGSNTGIYYAPVDLTDGVISSGGIPTSYFTVTVTGSDGNTYPLGQVPAGVSSVSSQINYETPFYNSMIYKIEEGYNGTDVGAGTGIPGVTLSNNNPEPGWMMQHFYMVYRTAYWCPYTDYNSHPNCFQAVNSNTAEYYSTHSIGTADLSASSYFDSGGETILAYYPGATVEGQVTLPGGLPVAGARVTILDEWGTPHMTMVTGNDGNFQLIAPPGNDSIIVSYGALQGLTQTGADQVSQYNFTVRPDQAYGADPIPIVLNVPLHPGTIAGTVYWNLANTSSYTPSKDQVIVGATVTASNGLGLTETALSDASGTYSFTGLPPGAYNMSLRVGSVTTSEGSVSVGGYTLSQNFGIGPTGLHGQVKNQAGVAVPDAVVTLASATSSITLLTDEGGNYSVAPLTPGNYSVQATYTDGTSSRVRALDISSFTTNSTLNLTLETPVSVTLRATVDGIPLPNFPIRFSPLVGTNGTSEVYSTGAGGWVSATLTPGNWSVYAFGAVNGTYVAGLTDLHLTATGVTSGLIGGTTLPVYPAARLAGTVSLSSGTGVQSGVVLGFEDPSGNLLQATTNASGKYSVFLPEGPYAVEANYTSSGTSEVAFEGLNLSSAQTLDLSLSPGFTYHATVGYTASNGVFETIANLPVDVVRVQGNVTARLVSGPDGTISLALPTDDNTYEISTHQFGFQPFSRGPYTDNQLTQLSRIDLTISNVTVDLQVLNTSFAHAPPLTNFTAISPSASTILNVSGTNQKVSLVPGTYLVSSWAPETGGGRLRLFTNVTLTVPVGSPTLYLNLSLYGTLRFVLNATTTSLSLVNDYARLAGAPGSFTLNGSALLTGFTAAPGTYNLWITSKNGTSSYAYFDPITLWRNGTTSPRNITLVPAANVQFSLRGLKNQVVNASIELRISNGNGTYGEFFTGPVGNATLVLPRGGYNFTLPSGYATTVLNVDGVDQYWNLTVNRSANTCAANPYGTSICDLVLNVSRALDSVDGTLASAAGVLQSDAFGTVTVIPEGSTSGNGTRVFPVSLGTFDLSLLPGRYILYTVIAPDGSPQVNLTTLVLPYSSSAVELPLTLEPGWAQTVLLSPASGLPNPGTTTLVFAHAGGFNVTLANVSIGTPFRLVLPSGTFRLSASAKVSPYGPVVNLLAETNVTVASSNAYLPVPLVPQWIRTATIVVAGSGSPNVRDGQTVSYELVVNDTGNAPLDLHVSGTPSAWPIHLSPANFTLGPAAGNRTQVVQALVTVPAGTLVSSAPLTFQVLLAGTTTSLDQATPSLVIVPEYNLTLAAETSANAVSANSVTLGFSIAATGNIQEDASLSIGNQAELQNDGWAVALEDTSGSVITSSETVTPGSAAFSAEVHFYARSRLPILPSMVEVIAVDGSHPETRASIVLPFPARGEIGLNSTGVVVTGPNLGSGPAPSWQAPLYEALVFLPGLAILVIAGTWRWWKTRKWVRR